MARIMCRWSRLNASLALGMAVLSAALLMAQGTPPRTAGTAATRPGNRQAAAVEFNKALQLYNDGKYADAKAENDKALLLDPTYDDAVRLRIVLQDKLANAGAGGGGPGATGPAGKARALTDQQVSIIRLMEMSRNDRTLNGVIPRQVREDFWNNVLVKEAGADTSRAAHDAFLSPNNFLEVARRIRESNNHAYMDQIKINTDPAVLAEFKTSVNTFVLQNCATAACHGGEKGGDFHLLTTRDNASIYTNFYIMSMYTARSGGKVIDRDAPERSLFLQYALPKQQSSNPHPGDVEVRNKFASTRDPRYTEFVTWVQSLALPRPNYGIPFDVGGAQEKAAEPATPTTPPARGR